MLLAVDIGNSSIKFGVFDNESLVSKFSIPTPKGSSLDELVFPVLENIPNTISTAIACSVIPRLNASFTACLNTRLGIDVVLVTNDFPFGLVIKYEPVTALGSDRVVNSFAAAHKYGVPCIVCSFGTATTIDVVSKDNELLGGLIAPGMAAMAKALHSTTAKLPEVEIKRHEAVINQTTETSIRSGIIYSQVGLVESTVARIKGQISGNPKVIATGGYGVMAAENTGIVDVIDENLLLDGLRILYSRI